MLPPFKKFNESATSRSARKHIRHRGRKQRNVLEASRSDAAKVWSYDQIGSSCSTVAMAGLVYATGYDGRLHCLDAETGRVYWVRDLDGSIAASPFVADGSPTLQDSSGRVVRILRKVSSDKIVRWGDAWCTKRCIS